MIRSNSFRQESRLLAFTCVLAVALAPPAPAQPGAQYPFDIRILNAGENEPAVEPSGGWPLTLSLTPNEFQEYGLASSSAWTSSYPFRTEERPTLDTAGFLAVWDPGDRPVCNSFFNRYWKRFYADVIIGNYDPDSGEPPPPALQIYDPSSSDYQPEALICPLKTAWVEITPGLNLPRSSACGDQARVSTFQHDQDSEYGSNSGWTEIGPCMGSPEDGYGDGHNPRLPGLVVLSDIGPSVTTRDNSGERLAQIRGANLAGFFQSIAYQLRDAGRKTTIRAHLNVPEGLFTPVVRTDLFVDPRACADSTMSSVDGWPETCGPVDPNGVDVTVRAFVVQGRAPDALDDLNEDGVVDVEDAELAGLEPLTHQAVFRFTQIHRGYHRPLYYDFDGNGQASPLSDEAPGGPSELTDPPP